MALLLCQFTNKTLYGQQTVLTTSYTSGVATNLTGNMGIVFSIQNNNSYPVKISNLSCYIPANNTSTWTLWYSPVEPLLGPPSNITTANGWIEVNPGGTNVVGPSTAGVFQILSNLSFVIPGNKTYRCALVSTNEIHYYGSTASPNNFFSNGVGILVGDNSVSTGYTGAFPGLTANTPRSFIGSITFEPNMVGSNNAGVSSLLSPIQFCASSQPIEVEVVNSGKIL